MGLLVAFGGIHVPGAAVRDTERGIESICTDFGFPSGEEFKWSPGRGLWMHAHLVDDRRHEFFTRILSRLEEEGI